MSAANELTNQVIDHIYRAGGYAWRATSVGVFDTKRMHFRASAKKGVSDILACFKGRLFAIEIKIGTDRLSEEQRGFMKNIEHAGGVAIVAFDFEQFKMEWLTKVAPQKCLNCGKEMVPVKDKMTGTITGYLWRCECMPVGVEVSIG
ncbi:MAG: hypothetical protein NUV80_04600 [Candidatus Berkelbacteria bacterium]|nr:hypothetical protein [Candidatus Berkelbacteria bacterium]